MKYSIIIPAYNIENHCHNILTFIEKTKKTRNDIEYIIVNDGSTDKTDIILSCEKNIVYTSHTNKGVSYSRNKGLSLASGEFILFLDADDEFSDDIFTCLDNVIQEHNSCDAYVYNYSINCTVVNKKKHIPITMSPYETMSLFLQHKLNLCICSICIRRDFIVNSNLHFPEKYNFGEDVFFILLLFINSKNDISYINNVLFNYNLNQAGTVQSVVTRNKIDVIELYELLFELRERMPQYIYTEIVSFQKRTFFYLIKLSLRFKVKDKETLNYLFSKKKVLNKESHNLYVVVFLFNILSPLLYRILDKRLLTDF